MASQKKSRSKCGLQVDRLHEERGREVVRAVTRQRRLVAVMWFKRFRVSGGFEAVVAELESGVWRLEYWLQVDRTS